MAESTITRTTFTDDLDHYYIADPVVYALLSRVLSNNIAIRDLTPFMQSTATSESICASTPACGLTRSS